MAKRIDAKQWDRAKELLAHFEKINAHALRTVAGRVGISYTSTRYIASGQLKRPGGSPKAPPAMTLKSKAS